MLVQACILAKAIHCSIPLLDRAEPLEVAQSPEHRSAFERVADTDSLEQRVRSLAAASSVVALALVILKA